MNDMTKKEMREVIERVQEIADEASDKLDDYFDSQESTDGIVEARLAALDLGWASYYMCKMLKKILRETMNETKETEEA